MNKRYDIIWRFLVGYVSSSFARFERQEVWFASKCTICKIREKKNVNMHGFSCYAYTSSSLVVIQAGTVVIEEKYWCNWGCGLSWLVINPKCKERFLKWKGNDLINEDDPKELPGSRRHELKWCEKKNL